jgi:hypothetical protein
MKTFNRQKLAGLIVLIFTTLLFLTGCAGNETVDACLHGHTYGFWGGLWHGIIAPVDFVVMLFRKDITMFAPNNNGALYALGFLIGSGGWGFLGGKGLAKKRKTNNH